MPPRQPEHFLEKGARDRFVEQPLPVLGEGAVIPDRIVHIQPDKPAVQQVVVDVLHELPFRADRVERLNQTGAQ